MSVASPNPLDQIASSIRGARDLPVAAAHDRASDPLVSLHRLLRGDTSTAPRSQSDATTPPAATPSATPPAGGLEAILGHEVLALISAAPLSAHARRKAVERAVVALGNPSHENVRSILAALLSE